MRVYMIITGLIPTMTIEENNIYCFRSPLHNGLNSEIISIQIKYLFLLNDKTFINNNLKMCRSFKKRMCNYL